MACRFEEQMRAQNFIRHNTVHVQLIEPDRVASKSL